MQRMICALAALCSLLMVNVVPMQAQSASGKAVEPSATPQEIDQPTDHARPATKPAPPATKTDAANVTKTPANPSNAETTVSDADTITVPEGKTVDGLTVHDRPLIIAGHVTNGVTAVNSAITIKPGATVDGDIVAFGGSVDNQAGASVKVVQRDSGVLPMLFALKSEPTSAPEGEAWTGGMSEHQRKRNDWTGGQLALLGLGLVGMLVLLTIAPRATHQVAGMVTLEPARCLVVGIIGAIVTLFVLIANAGLMKSPLGMLYAPVGALVAVLPLLVLAFGWLCGMRYAGDFIAQKTGRCNVSNRVYTRIALGLASFFLLNVILGALDMGFVGLFAEFVVALMGVGSVLITGGGKDPDWLGARLRGEARWFSRGGRV